MGKETSDVRKEESNDHPGSKIDSDSINFLSRIRGDLVSVRKARARNQEVAKDSQKASYEVNAVAQILLYFRKYELKT
jgi:hypothetical protein